jgi:hypothetical protein
MKISNMRRHTIRMETPSMAAEMAIVTAGTLQSPGKLPGYVKAGNTKTQWIPSDKCHKA